MAGRGRASKTSPRRIATALRRGQALQMRLDGAKYEEIMTTLGYASRGAAVADIQRALVLTVQEPADEVRALELQRLDMLWQTVLEILRSHHVVVSQGRVVFLNEEPIKDHAPILAAVDRLLKIQERRAKYLGLDAPKQLEFITIDALEAEIQRLNEEMERAARAGEIDAADDEDEDAGEFVGVEASPARGTPPTEG